MRRYVALMLLVSLSGLGLVACGGGGDDEGGGGATDTASDGGSGGSSDDLSSLFDQQSDARIKVTYETGDGTEITISRDGDRSAYFSDDSSTVSTPDGSFSCSGLDSDEPTCTELPEGLDGLGALAGFGLFGAWEQVVDSLDSSAFGDTSEEEIAGRSARCLTLDAGLLGDGSAQVCVDEETGVLLRLTSSGGGSDQNLEAIEVGDPDDADFEAPATPETIPDLGDITIPDLGDITIPGQ